ncbi:MULTISPECIES: histidine phosphatase family protein [Janthinobacterium]|uniref:Histidine phosphatase family protein n=2 Tax=Janthinobacterium TaxID=29580 RepID=A0ABT0WT21_9BURK|nr:MULTISPECIES: histidine phosphatase family protein [Janthinobacterium]MCM2567088.1 histidine phosphatase family protein [Janthinobacterium kumbetense]MDN2677313.1 histidine phosphatase family protein [Janthinobacterium sp. SUN033]MDO8037989.1 histidine phosphatase family protein [Janthinobacterium sp. SUN137]MDO8066400.1 histidine phosphatase family protein [Janthinobacterium sp. SUN206]
MRHGEPRLAKGRWIAPLQMGQWINLYNQSIIKEGGIPAQCAAAALSASTIVASTAPRACSSARALGDLPFMQEAMFSEAGLPFALWKAPWLPAEAWAAIFRLLWLFGYARGSDSLQITRRRARAAAERLVALAARGPVLLVGHGIMNRLIGKELQALGWLARNRQGSRYWSMGVYEL